MADSVCSLCGGDKKEHGPGLTQHAYTERPGEMLTHEQAAARQQQPQRQMMVMPTSSNPTQVERLIETLLEKGLIDTPEALYILGVGSKPEPKSGYQDPAQHPFYQPTPGAGY